MGAKPQNQMGIKVNLKSHREADETVQFGESCASRTGHGLRVSKYECRDH